MLMSNCRKLKISFIVYTNNYYRTRFTKYVIRNILTHDSRIVELNIFGRHGSKNAAHHYYSNQWILRQKQEDIILDMVLLLR